jgi:hypothetical protein
MGFPWLHWIDDSEASDDDELPIPEEESKREELLSLSAPAEEEK